MVGSRHAGVLFLLSSLTACGGVTAIGDGEKGGTAGSGAAGGTAGKASSTGGFGAAGGASAGGQRGDVYLYASGFNQKCVHDTDCVLVQEGIQCGCGSCKGNAAISIWERDGWGRAAREKSNNCVDHSCVAMERDCSPLLGACQQGACIAREPQYLNANQFPRACTTDSDCAVVTMGEVCDPCGCTFGAIAKSALPIFEKEAGALRQQCAPPPATCDCIVPGAPRCVPSRDGPGAQCELR